MDTSETYKKNIVNPLEPLEKIERVKWYEDPVYIKMCGCEEIQGQRTAETWEYGDAYTTVFRDLPYQGRVSWVYPINDAWADVPDYEKHRTECIWLPTQEDLQGMVLGGYKPIELAERFGGWLLSVYGWDYREQFTSMNQLWLAFMMKECHNKEWVNDEWRLK